MRNNVCNTHFGGQPEACRAQGTLLFADSLAAARVTMIAMHVYVSMSNTNSNNSSGGSGDRGGSSSSTVQSTSYAEAAAAATLSLRGPCEMRWCGMVGGVG
jgi:hypothetical protein